MSDDIEVVDTLYDAYLKATEEKDFSLYAKIL